MGIELADAVAAVRDELLEAASRGAGELLAFAVGPIEMEFAVELRADAKAKAGFKAWVVNAETEAGLGRTTTHTVKVTLTPKTPDGRDLLIAGPSGSRLAPAAETPGTPSGHIGR